jgi:hypothetical protein
MVPLARPSRIVSWIERLFAAVLLAAAFTAAVMAMVISPKVRHLVHLSGQPLSAFDALVLSFPWWPITVAILTVAFAMAVAARSPSARRAVIGAGLLLGGASFTIYVEVLGSRSRIRQLLFERDVLEPPREHALPSQLDPNR